MMSVQVVNGACPTVKAVLCYRASCITARAAEFRAEPQNVYFTAEFPRLRGIRRNLIKRTEVTTFRLLIFLFCAVR